MQNRIVLVSDDADFFEYILQRLKLRKSDEIFHWSFSKIPEEINLLKTAVLLINSENNEQKTLELMKLLGGLSVIVFAYNVNKNFETACYQAGALCFITPFIEDDEFKARIETALNIASNVGIAAKYRDILVRGNIILPNNEVYIDYENILDRELERIKQEASTAVLAAISPDEKNKFLIKSNQVEGVILNNIRKNDILMNYAPNKYFLLLNDTNIESAEKIWQKILNKLPEKIYAGFANVSTKTRQQIVNEVLNKLHEAINYNKNIVKSSSAGEIGLTGGNFKIFRQEFNKKIDKIVSPVFYHIQQKYNDRLFNTTIEQETGNGYSVLGIKSRHSSALFTITSPGFSKINIDISYQTKNAIPQKRFSLEPDELEAGFLEDLLEQFIDEFKKEISNDNT